MSTQQNLTVQQNLAIRLLRVLRYNKARSESAVELMPPKKRPLFHVMPFLLHVNHPDFPGFVDDEDTPHGLHNYSLRPMLTDALRAVFPELQDLSSDIKRYWPKTRRIDSLILMGSIGTIAQTKSSDFDYWVCIDNTQFTQRQMVLLQEKLLLIERWAEMHFDLETHFFVSEEEKVRNNDFGVAEGESSGSAQAIFLKAEFYTTNIVVAGKAPFWWLMPDRTTDEQYTDIIQSLKEGESPDPKLFIDLGNLEKMDPNELFGAAIWQISKAMDSPFKSVLKMAKLEVFLQNIERQQPLCNLLKKKVHNGAHARGNLAHTDPYALMFDVLVDYYERADKKDVAQLLQLCLYIKSDIRLSIPVTGDEVNFKYKMIQSYVKSWGWSNEKIKKVDRIKYWDFKDLSLLSRQIHSYLINCYRRMSNNFNNEKQLVSQEDMTVLGRKIEAFYSKKDGKVEYLRSAFDDELYCKVITLLAEVDKDNKKYWSMYGGDQLNGFDADKDRMLLKGSYHPSELIVWGVRNRILDGNTKILMDFETEQVTEDDLKNLARQAETLFPPVED